MKPKFQQDDCDKCEFIGHWFSHDVYICGQSVVARFGDEAHEYICQDLHDIWKKLLPDHRIGGVGPSGEDIQTWTDYLFSPEGSDAYKAVVCALLFWLLPEKDAYDRWHCQGCGRWFWDMGQNGTA